MRDPVEWVLWGLAALVTACSWLAVAWVFEEWPFS